MVDRELWKSLRGHLCGMAQFLLDSYSLQWCTIEQILCQKQHDQALAPLAPALRSREAGVALLFKGGRARG